MSANTTNNAKIVALLSSKFNPRTQVLPIGRLSFLVLKSECVQLVTNTYNIVATLRIPCYNSANFVPQQDVLECVELCGDANGGCQEHIVNFGYAENNDVVTLQLYTTQVQYTPALVTRLFPPAAWKIEIVVNPLELARGILHQTQTMPSCTHLELSNKHATNHASLCAVDLNDKLVVAKTAYQLEFLQRTKVVKSNGDGSPFESNFSCVIEMKYWELFVTWTRLLVLNGALPHEIYPKLTIACTSDSQVEMTIFASDHFESGYVYRAVVDPSECKIGRFAKNH